MAAERIGSIEITEDMRFQETSWKVQRVFWILMAMVLVAALLGLFGTGVVSKAEARSEKMALRYDRFARLEKSTRLQFYLERVPPDGAARLSIDRAYLNEMQIDQISPAPTKVLGVGEQWIYEFAGEPEQPLYVTFRLIPQRAGRFRCNVWFNDANRLVFGQFVYP